MIERIRQIIGKLNKQIEPIKGILYFLFLFLLFEFLWKLCIKEEYRGESIFFFGKDITNLVYPVCLWTAKATYWIIHDLMGYSNFHIDGILIYFDNSLRLKIVWGCTGVKQIILFTFIMLCYFGPRKKKLKYILISVFILNFINILRLVVTAFIVKGGVPDWFISFNQVFNNTVWDNSPQTYWRFYSDWYYFFHDGFFKWVYYDGVMFLLWLYWQEKINLPYQRTKSQN